MELCYQSPFSFLCQQPLFFLRASRFSLVASIFEFATSKSPCTTVISPMSLVFMAYCSLWIDSWKKHSALRKSSSCVACSFVMLLCTSKSDLFLDYNSFRMFLLVCLSIMLHILLFSCFSFLFLLFAMIKSVVKSLKVPVVEVVAARLSNESLLPCTTSSTPKNLVDLTLVLDGWVNSNFPDEIFASGRFHHV